MKRLFLALTIALFAVIPVSTSAAGVHVASDIVTSDGDVFSDNQYVIGGKVTAGGTMEQDVLLLGGRANLPASVRGDALIFGGESVLLDGVVDGDARIFGGDVTVAGTVSGDVVVVGGIVHIAKEANLTGEVLIVGGRVTMDAVLQKHARIIADTVILGGVIENTANITSQHFSLGETARVPGTIVYFAPQEARKANGTEVTGSVSFNKIDSIRQNGIVERAVVNFLNFWIVLRFVTTLLLTFLLVYIFRVFSQKTTEYVLHSFGTSVLTGVLTVLFVPVIGVILFVSLILMPVAMILALCYIAVMIVSSAVASIAIGSLINRAFSKKTALEVSFKTASLGVVLLTLVQFVPIVGEATRLVFFLAALGAVWRYVYEHVRRREIALFQK